MEELIDNSKNNKDANDHWVYVSQQSIINLWENFVVGFDSSLQIFQWQIVGEHQYLNVQKHYCVQGDRVVVEQPQPVEPSVWSKENEVN